MCFQQGMANPTIAYGMDGTNNVSINTFTYQTAPQQQAPPIDTQQQPLVQTQPPPPIAPGQPMQALAGMAANSAYQILSQPQQQVQGSPTSAQQQQQAVVSLPQAQQSDYSCGTSEGMYIYSVRAWRVFVVGYL